LVFGRVIDFLNVFIYLFLLLFPNKRQGSDRSRHCGSFCVCVCSIAQCPFPARIPGQAVSHPGGRSDASTVIEIPPQLCVPGAQAHASLPFFQASSDAASSHNEESSDFHAEVRRCTLHSEVQKLCCFLWPFYVRRRRVISLTQPHPAVAVALFSDDGGSSPPTPPRPVVVLTRWRRRRRACPACRRPSGSTGPSTGACWRW